MDRSLPDCLFMLDTIRMQAVKAETPTVLLVEDDQGVARGLGRMIEQLGYGVVHASTAQKGIELVMDRSFEVVLADLHLDGGSGIDVLGVARAYHDDIALVLITAEPNVETARAAVNLGVLEYLLKPFARDQVKRALERATTRRRSGTQAAVVLSPIDEAQVERFELALESMTVDLEPICSATSRDLVGFVSRFTSAEETLASETALVRAAELVGRTSELRRRMRDLSVRAFAAAPASSLLFVDIQVTDLADEELYSTEPPLARIAERVVLQLRGGLGDQTVEDVASRMSVLRFVGYRLAIADLDGTQSFVGALAEIAPDFAKVDARIVRGIAHSSSNRRIVAAIASMCAVLGIDAIAEGVGNAEDRQTLVEVGCRLVQGSLVARHSPSASRHPSITAASIRMRQTCARES